MDDTKTTKAIQLEKHLKNMWIEEAGKIPKDAFKNLKISNRNTIKLYERNT